MLLVDSSVWIDAGLSLRSLVRETRGQLVAVCPPIVHEVLQGTDDEQSFQLTRALLRTARLVDAEMPLERFEEAAAINRACRMAGHTIRSSYDCLIAASAIAHGIPLFAADRDFQFIARATNLQLFTRS